MNRYQGYAAAAVILLAALVVTVLAGCDTVNEQRNFADEASRRPSGITRTEESGEVEEVDQDDWRTAPLYRGIVRVEPAYPNPVTSTQQWVTIPFWVQASDEIAGDLTLRAYDDKGQFIALRRQDLQGFGSYQFDFHPSELSSAGSVTSVEGLHRLFIFDAQGELVSYGDLRIALEEEE